MMFCPATTASAHTCGAHWPQPGGWLTPLREGWSSCCLGPWTSAAGTGTCPACQLCQASLLSLPCLPSPPSPPCHLSRLSPGTPVRSGINVCLSALAEQGRHAWSCACAACCWLQSTSMGSARQGAARAGNAGLAALCGRQDPTSVGDLPGIMPIRAFMGRFLPARHRLTERAAVTAGRQTGTSVCRNARQLGKQEPQPGQACVVSYHNSSSIRHSPQKKRTDLHMGAQDCLGWSHGEK